MQNLLRLAFFPVRLMQPCNSVAMSAVGSEFVNDLPICVIAANEQPVSLRKIARMPLSRECIVCRSACVYESEHHSVVLLRHNENLFTATLNRLRGQCLVYPERWIDAVRRSPDYP